LHHWIQLLASIDAAARIRCSAPRISRPSYSYFHSRLSCSYPSSQLTASGNTAARTCRPSCLCNSSHLLISSLPQLTSSPQRSLQLSPSVAPAVRLGRSSCLHQSLQLLNPAAHIDRFNCLHQSLQLLATFDPAVPTVATAARINRPSLTYPSIQLLASVDTAALIRSLSCSHPPT
jgi:hypothetical protein